MKINKGFFKKYKMYIIVGVIILGALFLSQCDFKAKADQEWLYPNIWDSEVEYTPGGNPWLVGDLNVSALRYDYENYVMVGFDTTVDGSPSRVRQMVITFDVSTINSSDSITGGKVRLWVDSTHFAEPWGESWYIDLVGWDCDDNLDYALSDRTAIYDDGVMYGQESVSSSVDGQFWEFDLSGDFESFIKDNADEDGMVSFCVMTDYQFSNEMPVNGSTADSYYVKISSQGGLHRSELILSGSISEDPPNIPSMPSGNWTTAQFYSDGGLADGIFQKTWGSWDFVLNASTSSVSVEQGDYLLVGYHSYVDGNWSLYDSAITFNLSGLPHHMLKQAFIGIKVDMTISNSSNWGNGCYVWLMGGYPNDSEHYVGEDMDSGYRHGIRLGGPQWIDSFDSGEWVYWDLKDYYSMNYRGYSYLMEHVADDGLLPVYIMCSNHVTGIEPYKPYGYYSQTARLFSTDESYANRPVLWVQYYDEEWQGGLPITDEISDDSIWDIWADWPCGRGVEQCSIPWDIDSGEHYNAVYEYDSVIDINFVPGSYSWEDSLIANASSLMYGDVLQVGWYYSQINNDEYLLYSSDLVFNISGFSEYSPVVRNGSLFVYLEDFDSYGGVKRLQIIGAYGREYNTSSIWVSDKSYPYLDDRDIYRPSTLTKVVTITKDDIGKYVELPLTQYGMNWIAGQDMSNTSVYDEKGFINMHLLCGYNLNGYQPLQEQQSVFLNGARANFSTCVDNKHPMLLFYTDAYYQGSDGSSGGPGSGGGGGKFSGWINTFLNDVGLGTMVVRWAIMFGLGLVLFYVFRQDKVMRILMPSLCVGLGIVLSWVPIWFLVVLGLIIGAVVFVSIRKGVFE